MAGVRLDQHRANVYSQFGEAGRIRRAFQVIPTIGSAALSLEFGIGAGAATLIGSSLTNAGVVCSWKPTQSAQEPKCDTRRE